MKLQLSHPSIGTFGLMVEPGAELILGRDTSEADLELPWDPRVSRRHARVWVEAGACWYEDLASKNGSYLDGQRIEGAVRFRPGARMLLGDTSIELAPTDGTPWADVTETDQRLAPAETLRSLPMKHLESFEALVAQRDRAPEPAAAHAGSRSPHVVAAERSAPTDSAAPHRPRRSAAPARPGPRRPSIRFTGRRRVRIEGAGLQRLWRSELAKGALFVEGEVPVVRGDRLWVDISLDQGLFEISAEVVHVGMGPSGAVGAGLAITALPAPFRSALEAGVDSTTVSTVEVEAPVELIEAAERGPRPRLGSVPGRSASSTPRGPFDSVEPDPLRFVGLVEADCFYEAVGCSAETTDMELLALLKDLRAHFDGLGDSHESAREQALRGWEKVDQQLGSTLRRLRYDFARGYIFAERRRELARLGVGPSLATLASSWRQAFPAKAERARRLLEAADRAAAQGREEEAERLRKQARALAPFSGS